MYFMKVNALVDNFLSWCAGSFRGLARPFGMMNRTPRCRRSPRNHQLVTSCSLLSAHKPTLQMQPPETTRAHAGPNAQDKQNLHRDLCEKFNLHPLVIALPCLHKQRQTDVHGHLQRAAGEPGCCDGSDKPLVEREGAGGDAALM